MSVVAVVARKAATRQAKSLARQTVVTRRREEQARQLFGQLGVAVTGQRVTTGDLPGFLANL